MLYIPDSEIERLFREDLPITDLTTLAMGIEDIPGEVLCYPKKDCVLAGVEEAARLFQMAGLKTEILFPSGSHAKAKVICLKAKGTAGAIHSSYKQGQNIMEYSSAVATRTAQLVDSAREANPDVRIAGTRKHFPGGKLLSIKAVLVGGGTFHRLGLSDSILSFDQHRVFTDDFKNLIPKMQKIFPEKVIEAEANSPEEAIDFVKAGLKAVQCERFAVDDLKNFAAKAKKINPDILITAAGGITIDNVKQYAGAGAGVLVTSWMYFGKPQDIKMEIKRA